MNYFKIYKIVIKNNKKLKKKIRILVIYFNNI